MIGYPANTPLLLPRTADAPVTFMAEGIDAAVFAALVSRDGGAFGNSQGWGDGAAYPDYTAQQFLYLQQQYLQQQYLQQQAAQRQQSAAVSVQCRVVGVIDGDTLDVLLANGEQHRLRLHGIDAPERRQAFGTKAGDRLADLTLGKIVEVKPGGPDKYGRTVANVEIGGQDVGQTLVAEGLAWHYVRFSDDAGLAEAQRAAQIAGRGVWSDPGPTPPWDWRAGTAIVVGSGPNRRNAPGYVLVPRR